MPESVTVRVDGKSVVVPAGATAAVAILISGAVSRTSVTGEPRTPFCGMGTCFECRSEINGTPYLRSCQILCEPGMEIQTNGYTNGYFDARPF
jgi:predicted molibdopterin-dependent oxidoreductase YjgC